MNHVRSHRCTDSTMNVCGNMDRTSHAHGTDIAQTQHRNRNRNTDRGTGSYRAMASVHSSACESVTRDVPHLCIRAGVCCSCSCSCSSPCVCQCERVALLYRDLRLPLAVCADRRSYSVCTWRTVTIHTDAGSGTQTAKHAAHDTHTDM